jgi:hypothetical protein
MPAKRLVPRQRPNNPSVFTVADRTKLNSIEFGANIGGFPTVEDENIPISFNEEVFNFSGHVEVTDQGFQTDIVIPLDIDGGIF